MTDKIMANGPKVSASILMALVALGMSTGQVGAEPPKSAQPNRPEVAKADPTKVDPTKPDAGKPETAKTDGTKTTPQQADAGKPVAPDDDAMPAEAQASVKKYCLNIAAAASDARFAWQSKKLLELETKVKARIAELEAKQEELKSWYEKREAINKEAKETLVGIYSKMKPETAAAQISALDDDMATAVLAALSPGKASAIFNEITPTDRAAKLAGLLANPMAVPAEKKL